MTRPPIRESAIALVILLGLLVALNSNAPPEMAAIAAPAPAISTHLAQADKSPLTPVPVNLLKVEPVNGYAGDSFTVTGNGFIPGQKVDFFWATVDGAYATRVLPDNVEYHERKYDEKRLRLGGTLVDSQGRVNTVFTAPEDFGEVQDIYAVVDGEEVGRGGLRIVRGAAMNTTEE